MKGLEPLHSKILNFESSASTIPPHRLAAYYHIMGLRGLEPLKPKHGFTIHRNNHSATTPHFSW